MKYIFIERAKKQELKNYLFEVPSLSNPTTVENKEEKTKCAKNI